MNLLRKYMFAKFFLFEMSNNFLHVSQQKRSLCSLKCLTKMGKLVVSYLECCLLGPPKNDFELDGSSIDLIQGAQEVRSR